MTKTLAVRRLTLSHFRSYVSFTLTLEPGPVVIAGRNGIGKTNLLEAVSFLSPGRGLRGAKLTEIDYQHNTQPWAVAAAVDGMDGQNSIGTGRSPVLEKIAKRVVKVDGEMMRGQAGLASLFSVIWLTPQMDQLFQAASSERRRFLDRLVYHFDPEHARRVMVYEYAMRERARLLKHGGADGKWLASLEHKMAEAAVSIAAARRETLDVIQHAVLQAVTPFPKAMLGIEGEVEAWLADSPALQVEEKLLATLADMRRVDAMSGRTGIGTHRSDLTVMHRDKNMPASLCSTGEQKAMLLSIVLAEARARGGWRNSVPVLLLDEVVAHLDGDRREALFNEITALKAQAWLTGTDAFLFESLSGAQRVVL